MLDTELEDFEWWKRVLEVAGVGICKVDKNFNVTYVNARMAAMLGYSAEEMTEENLLSFVQEEWKNAMSMHLEKKDANEGYEFDLLRNDGSRISVLISSDCVFDADGKFEGGTFAAIEITKQKGTEELLRASRNTVETILDAISGSLRSVDGESRIAGLMNRIKELLESDAFICSVQEKQRIIDELSLHSEHLKELVEERVQELLRAERLAAVGQAAAMIAHDLRNPLQNIRLAQHLLGKHCPHEGGLLNQIDRNVAYADGVVNSLLIYSQERPLNRQETNINQLLRDSLKESAPPEHIKVEEKLREVPSIYVDQNQMKRVFQNLILNAIQAMEREGTLTLETKLVENSVVVSVQDTGQGISEIKQDSIWKPFHTSKPKGMGLGLSIAKRIVESHGGTIDVKSKLGEGTTFTVYMPMHIPSATTFGPSERQKVVSQGEKV